LGRLAVYFKVLVRIGMMEEEAVFVERIDFINTFEWGFRNQR
jgi:hypothetical protein